MNPRIRLLAEQADVFADQKIKMPGEHHPDWHDVRDQHFAELIVRECSSICRGVGDAVWAEQHQSNIGTARTCELAIQKHFGVEE